MTAVVRHSQRSTLSNGAGPVAKTPAPRQYAGQHMPTATNIYRSLMLELERRRFALGLPQERFCEYAGLSDRYYAKALHADEPSGRQAQWSSVQALVDALFPHGFDLELRPKPGQVISPTNLKAKLLHLRAHHDPRSQRQLMQELGKKGGRVRAARLSERRRIAIARRAAKARWRTPKVTEIDQKDRGA
jgi:hypothetical protein